MKKKQTPPRKAGGEKMRGKINVLALIEALEQHVIGGKKMSATQVSAALALLKKTMPDLTKPLSDKTASKTHEDALEDLE